MRGNRNVAYAVITINRKKRGQRAILLCMCRKRRSRRSVHWNHQGHETRSWHPNDRGSMYVLTRNEILTSFVLLLFRKRPWYHIPTIVGGNNVCSHHEKRLFFCTLSFFCFFGFWHVTDQTTDIWHASKHIRRLWWPVWSLLSFIRTSFHHRITRWGETIMTFVCVCVCMYVWNVCHQVLEMTLKSSYWAFDKTESMRSRTNTRRLLE